MKKQRQEERRETEGEVGKERDDMVGKGKSKVKETKDRIRKRRGQGKELKSNTGYEKEKEKRQGSNNSKNRRDIMKKGREDIRKGTKCRLRKWGETI